MSRRDHDALVQDLIGFCRETADALTGVDIDDFLDSKVLQRAVERLLELVGEATTQLGDARPAIDVPWPEIARVRVVLAHLYQQVDPVVVYTMAIRDVPDLLEKLERFVEGRARDTRAPK